VRHLRRRLDRAVDESLPDEPTRRDNGSMLRMVIQSKAGEQGNRGWRWRRFVSDRPAGGCLPSVRAVTTRVASPSCGRPFAL